MATTYDVYFGEAGDVSLVSIEQADAEWTIPVGELEYGVEYEWRIDSVNEYGISYGDVWSFTAVVFTPPADSDRATTRRIVAAANDKIWYEDV